MTAFDTVVGSQSVSEDKVEKQEETNQHGRNDEVGAVSAVTGNLFQASGAELKGFGRGSDAVAFALHHVDFVLVFKHTVQVAPHLVGNCVEGLLNSIGLAPRLALLHVEVGACEVVGPVEGSLQFVYHVPSHRVQSLNALRVLLKLRTALIQHV